MRSSLLSLLLILVTAVVFFSVSYFCLGIEKSIQNTCIGIIIGFAVGDYFRRYCLPARKLQKESEEDIFEMMNRWFFSSKFAKYLQNCSDGKIILLALLWTMAVSVIISVIDEPLPDVAEDWGIGLVIIVGLLLAPVLETLIFQVLIIEGCKRVTPKIDGKDNLLFAMLVSAIFFGLGHGYSTSYIIYAFLMGIGFSFVYTFVRMKPGKTWKNGFWSVVLLHLIINSIASVDFIIEYCQ